MTDSITFDDRTEKRFWGKVDKSAGDDACWTWLGFFQNGYGFFTVGRKNYGAHRFSLAVATGRLPNNLLGCHKCNNRKCVNPDHLYWGTAQDNARDHAKTEKFARGVRSAQAIAKEKEDLYKLLKSGHVLITPEDAEKQKAHRRRMAEKMARYEGALRQIHRDGYEQGRLWASGMAQNALNPTDPAKS